MLSPASGEAAEKHTVFQVYFYNTQKIHQFRLFWWIFCYPDKISDYFRCYLCLFFVYQLFLFDGKLAEYAGIMDNSGRTGFYERSGLL